MREWLINLRNIKGFTQKEVSAMCGISRSFYADIEQGTRNPKPLTAQDIGKVLGFDWTLFFERNGRDSRQSKKSA